MAVMARAMRISFEWRRGLATAQVVDLQALDWFHIFWLNQLGFFINMGQFLDGVDENSCRWTK